MGTALDVWEVIQAVQDFGSAERLLAESDLAEPQLRVALACAPIVRTWAGEDRHHTGCAILVGIDHSEFGTILKRIEDELAWRPRQQAWQDYTALIGRRAPAR